MAALRVSVLTQHCVAIAEKTLSAHTIDSVEALQAMLENARLTTKRAVLGGPAGLGPEPIITMDGQCAFNALPRVFTDGVGG